MAFKGSRYVGQMTDKFGGFYGDNPQPKGFGKFGSTDKNSSGDPPSRKGSMLGQKWKPTCKTCGGKM